MKIATKPALFFEYSVFGTGQKKQKTLSLQA